MLRTFKSLRNHNIAARDGEIGSVHDFYFDDQGWVIRYLVVDTGRWLPGRKVLLAPHLVHAPKWSESSVAVDLSREQVKTSPDIDTEKPVSKQRQEELHRHYAWPVYWAGAGAFPDPVMAVVPGAIPSEPPGLFPMPAGDPHLRSTREVIGYHIKATDGLIGHADDLVIDLEAWVVRYIVVDTRNWLAGKKVLIPPQWLAGPISWDERAIAVFLAQEKIKESPEYDPNIPVNREYESRLYDYYGRPGYWTGPEAAEPRLVR